MEGVTLTDRTYDLVTHAQSLDDAVAADNWSGAMATMRKCMEELQEIAPLLVQRGVHAGMTQKRMADLWVFQRRT